MLWLNQDCLSADRIIDSRVFVSIFSITFVVAGKPSKELMSGEKFNIYLFYYLGVIQS
ncbi:MAG: hypothetical protein ACTSWN_11110 [Promethearchaeota archaeon]